MDFGPIILLLALVLFSLLAFQRISAIILGPLVSLFVIIFTGLPIIESLKGPFMESAAGYVQSYFLMFFVGALFGAIYEKTRAAESVARAVVKLSRGKFAAAIIMCITGLLTYGGISGFVVFFAMYPIALQLFKNTNLTRRLIPAAISAGTWTWSMSGPGSPSIQNVLPIDYLGTNARAAFVPSVIVTIAEFALIFAWLEWRSRSFTKKGYHFDDDRLTPLPAGVLSEDEDLSGLPNPILSLIPLILILVSFNGIPFTSFDGIDVIAAVFLGIVAAVILLWKHIPSIRDWIDVFNKGAGNSTTAILNTAIVVGFAGVVRTTKAFSDLIGALTRMRMSPMVFVAITVAIAAGAAGSASGGMGIAFEALGDLYASMDVLPEHVHRIAAIAAGTLDTLPHQGAQITLLTLCSLTHKEAYFDIAITQIIIPIITLILFMPIASMGL